ncbi:YbaN family protein [Clostridium sp.]|uniref:YbaN family protein n=1 Tax=Clostridium sp. TaxID=1506 RepID=UPI002589592E|nr:YbaN family protein [Clostridium sp.]
MRIKKYVIFIAGCILIVIASIGIFLPILSTTPFVILAAMCFSVSSEKAYRLLAKNRFFGPYIENYKTGNGVTVKAKIKGIMMLWVLLIISAVVMHKLWSSVMLIVIGSVVTIHLLLLKTRSLEKISDSYSKK